MKKIAIIMDDISQINVKKDTTFAMMLEAQIREYEVFTLDTNNIFVSNSEVLAFCNKTIVFENQDKFFTKENTITIELKKFDIILMRKDPPFNMNYIYATYLLEMVQQLGVLVVNNPKALRDFNEKLVILNFPKCITKTIISTDIITIKKFIKSQDKTILKPLDGMGGNDIFLITPDDNAQDKIITYLTDKGKRLIMAQKYIPDIKDGDKRIIIIDGKPIPYALARMPQEGDFKGNIAAGGTGVGVELNDRDYFLCEQIAPTLKNNGLLFVGLDVIGDYITEINVTSPTCVRQLDEIYNINISRDFFDTLESKIT